MFEKLDKAVTEVTMKVEKFCDEHPTAAKLIGIGAVACVIYKRGYSKGHEVGYNECTEDCLCYYLTEAAKNEKPTGPKF